MECYSAMKRNDSDTCNTLDGPQDNYAKYKKLVVPCGLEGKESGCNAGDSGSVPGLGRSPGEGNGYQLQYSCLENSMDRGAWWLQSMGSQRDTTEQLSTLIKTVRSWEGVAGRSEGGRASSRM